MVEAVDTIANDSDVDSNSSWTILDETKNFIADNNSSLNDKHQEKDTADILNELSDIEITENEKGVNDLSNIDLEQSSNCDIHINNLTDNYFFSSKEYEAADQYITVPEYGSDSDKNFKFLSCSKSDKNLKLLSCYKSAKKHKQRRRSKRQKHLANSLGLLTIIGTVLSITGISLFYLLLSNLNKSGLNSKDLIKPTHEFIENLNKSNPNLLDKALFSLNNDDVKNIYVDSIKNSKRPIQMTSKQIQRYLRRNKEYKSTKPIYLGNNDNHVKNDKVVCPLTFEEYVNQNRNYLNIIKKQDNKYIETPNNTNSKSQSQSTNVIRDTKPEILETSGIKNELKELSTSYKLIENVPKTDEKSIKLKKKPMTGYHKLHAKIKNDFNFQDMYYYSLTSAGLACNLLQDIALLKLMSEFTIRTYKKKLHKKINNMKLEKKLNSRMAVITSSRSQLKPITSLKVKSRCTFNTLSNTSLKLWNELPFSDYCNSEDVQENLSKKSSDKKIDVFSKMNLFRLYKQQSDAQKLCTICNSKRQNFQYQSELLNNIKYLKEVRNKLYYCNNLENQRKLNPNLQFILQADMKYIKNISKLCDVACGQYNVPIPNTMEMTIELQKLGKTRAATGCYHFNSCQLDKEQDSHKDNVSSHGCYEAENKTKQKFLANSIKYNCNNELLANKSKFYQKHKYSDSLFQKSSSNQHKKVEFKNNKKIKFYNLIEKYWIKREEYLEKRIQFMEQVLQSINSKENSQDCWNLNNINYTLRKADDKAVKIFPSDNALQNLKCQLKEKQGNKITSMAGSNNNLQEICTELRGNKECRSSLQFSENQTLIPQIQSRNDLPFKFCAINYHLAVPTTKKLKAETLYTCLFRREDWKHIQKRDLAMLYLNKVLRRKHFKKRYKHI